VEGKASVQVVDLAEKWPVAGRRIFSGKRVRLCGAANDGSGRTFCTGHR